MDAPEDLDALETLLARRGVDLGTLEASPAETLLPEHLQQSKELGALVHELPRLVTVEGDPSGAELQVTGALGEGGMGVVWLARQWTLGREVAVKMLRAERRADVGARRAMLEEAWVTGRLEHPNIIPVHALGVDEQTAPLLVMKRVVGVSWRDALEDPGSLPARYQEMDRLSAHLEILGQVCDAVHFAHAHGVLHRDIKPDNVMLGEFGEVYLVDWGIAVALGPEAGARIPLAREVDAPAGTPAYMAPEMALGEGARLGPRTDVYLLGALLHELVTGRARHEGASTMAALLNAARSEPAEYPPEVPAELADLCRRATHADPARRPGSAEAFRRELDAFARHATARQLAAEAREQLDALRSWSREDAAGLEAPARVEVYRAFGACRFGFEQALAQWPGFPTARQGRHDALASMFELELAWGNLAAAQALLAELDAPPDGASARLEALRDERAREAARVARLEQMERDLDIEVGGRRRAWVVALLTLLWFSGPLVFGVLYRGVPEATFEQVNLVGRACVAVLVMVVILIANRYISQSLANRWVVVIAALIMLTSVMSAVFDLVLPLRPPQALLIEYFVYMTFGLGFSQMLDRRLVPTGLIFGMFWPLTLVVPEPYHFELGGVLNLLGTGYTAWVWGTGGGITGLLERLDLVDRKATRTDPRPPDSGGR